MARRKKLCGEPNGARGGTCRRPALTNGKCELHGGRFRDNQQIKSWRDAMRSLGLDGADAPWYDAIPVGRMADEIRMLKVSLLKAYAAQRQLEDGELDEEDMPLMRLEEDSSKTEDSDEGKPKRTHKTKRKKTLRQQRDYLEDILRISNTIGRLEVRHAELLDKARESGAISSLAEELRRFASAAEKTLPKETDGDEGDVSG